jgi:hypothetical protein
LTSVVAVGLSLFALTYAGWIAVPVAINLAVNLIFFMTHPIFTPYYIIPIDMLSALEFAVRNARSARRMGRRQCGLPSTGQRLIAV